jgi:hypothetical protein
LIVFFASINGILKTKIYGTHKADYGDICPPRKWLLWNQCVANDFRGIDKDTYPEIQKSAFKFLLPQICRSNSWIEQKGGAKGRPVTDFLPTTR